MAAILIIEDDEKFRELLQLMLGRLGYTVHCAVNGVDALYQASHYKPDLIILDLMMPWASGDAVLGFIRSTDELKHTPVLVVSAHPNGAQIARQLEADGFLAKPVDFRVFRECVQQLVPI
ncbi:MAG: response regulator [Anaerolineae bacterium]|nr:response regulator [Anaerolineae bacterium]